MYAEKHHREGERDRKSCCHHRLRHSDGAGKADQGRCPMTTDN